MIPWGLGGLQVGFSTFSPGVSAPQETEQLGLGALIMSGLGNGPGEAKTTAPSRTAADANMSTLGFAAFTGDGGRWRAVVNWMVGFCSGAIAFVCVLW